MHFTCTQKDLKYGLSVVSHAISARSTLPILANVLLTIDQAQRQIRLSATNLEIGITCTLPADITDADPESFTVPAKLLTEFVASLPPGPVELHLADKSTALRITGLRSTAHIKGQEVSQFPVIPRIAEAGEVLLSFESEQLKEAIASVAFAAAEDESRPVLTGVYVHQEAENLTFAAADAFSLAVRSYPMLDADEAILTSGILIPARTLVDLARILPPDEIVEMILTPVRNQVLFHTPTVDLVSRLIEGTYPNYRATIPAKCNTRAVLETKVFAEAVKSVALFARDSSNILRVSVVPGPDGGLGNGLLQLEASTEDVGDSASALDAAVDGEEVKITLNVKYLAEVLTNIKTAEVAIELNSLSRPAVLRPVGADGQCFVIMPMHIAR